MLLNKIIETTGQSQTPLFQMFKNLNFINVFTKGGNTLGVKIFFTDYNTPHSHHHEMGPISISFTNPTQNHYTSQ